MNCRQASDRGRERNSHLPESSSGLELRFAPTP